MKFGVSLTGFAQQPAGTDMRRVVGDILEYVKEARALGFDFVYQGQHYLTDPYLQLQNLPFLARVAAEAEGMGIVATQVVPLLNPVDLAERCATMDILTGGKFVLSAALGYRDQEYAAFNVDRRTRVSRMVECLEVVKRLWTEDTVDHRGSHFTLDGARMPLKPLQKPHPPIWIAANSDAAVVRAARLGYTWYVNPHATYATIKDQIELYRRAGEEAGTDAAHAPLPMARELYVHTDQETAYAEAAPYLGGKYETYSRWGQDDALPDDSFSSAFRELSRERFIIGSPEDCIADLKRCEELGVDRLALRMVWPGMPLDKAMEALRLFAAKVMPAFTA